MSKPLESAARHCLFIIREGAFTKKLGLPSDWQSAFVTTNDQFWSCVQQTAENAQRRIIVLSEDDYDGVIQVLRNRAGSIPLSRLGCLVLAKDPDAFLRKGHEAAELLDAVQEKEFRKGPTFHLMRAVRLLLRAEDHANRRVNQATLEKLNRIFISLSAERDPKKLLSTILLKAMDLALAESGTLFMIEETDGEITFRLKITSEKGNAPTIAPVESKVVESSVAGYVALTGKSVNFANVQEIRPLSIPQLQKGIDHVDQESRAILTVPLKNSRNEIVAIVQLVNKKMEPEGEIVSSGVFEVEDESLLASFATQAAICLENADLYADIQRLFEGFVRASITAIESRDPSTGGHSERVARLSVGLARATSECEVGIYRSVRFKEEEIRELEYAALLHDFGKIGVREEVLVKAKKLYSWQLDSIKERIKVCKAAVKIAYLEKRLRGVMSESAAEKEYQQKIVQIDSYWQIILTANNPAVLKKENEEALEKIRNEQLLLPDGQQIALLTEEEFKALSVTQGSLTENERLEIESHVRHTYQFLKMIPWTKDFKHLPDIAYGHHEKLDGTGYPRGLMSHEIPLQSKIMTIADIYDALTAADRWYKEAVPTERALDILALEVAQGKIDPVLFELFVERKVYESTQPKIIHRVA